LIQPFGLVILALEVKIRFPVSTQSRDFITVTTAGMDNRRAKWLVAGLVVAHVVLHAIALSLILGGMPHALTPSPSAITMFALFWLGPSQGILLGVWVAFGGGKCLWRVIPTALAAILYAWCVSNVNGRWQQEWLMFAVVALGLSAAVLLLARCAGLQLTKCSDAKATFSPFQFYIRDIMAWTAAVAVVMSAWRCLPTAAFGFLRQSIPAVAFIAYPLVAVVSMFVALRRRWLVTGLVLLPITVILGAKLMYNVTRSPYPLSYFIFMLGSLAVWLTASFLLLRFAGYRLTWRSWRAKPQENVVE
jgi:hypothetical protein